MRDPTGLKLLSKISNRDADGCLPKDGTEASAILERNSSQSWGVALALIDDAKLPLGLLVRGVEVLWIDGIVAVSFIEKAIRK